MSEESILRALRDCDPAEPLEPTDPRFWDFDKIRGAGIGQRLGRLLQVAEMQGDFPRFVKVAIAGHRGGGKSTEINRIHADLTAKGYHPIIVEVDKVLNKNEISFSDIIRLLLMVLDEDFGDVAGQQPGVKQAMDVVREWYVEVTKSREKVIGQAQEFGLNVAVGGQVKGEAGVGVKISSEMGKLLAGLNVVSKSDSQERTEIKEIVERYPDQLVQNLNFLLRALRQAVPERFGRGLVLILDNVDRYEAKVVNQAFIRQAGLYQEIEAHLVFTIQASFLHNPPEESVGNGFTPLELPMLPVFEERSRAPRQFVVDEIRKAVYQRVPAVLFAEGDVGANELILKSGGCWRDLLRLLQSVLLIAEGQITKASRERAQGEIAQSFHRLVQNREQLTILAQIQKTHELLPDENSRYLLFNRCILHYSGGWYAAHPLMDRILDSSRSKSIDLTHLAPRADDPLIRQTLSSVELTNFRCFDSVRLELSRETGWTCLAGINGVGKSSILQAIALLMLGPNLGRELGGSRLGALRRGNQGVATVRGVFQGGDGLESAVSISIDDTDQTIFVSEGDPELWKHLHSAPFVAYGATRNLSRSSDSRHDALSLEVRQQMSLFDPLTQLASVEVLLNDSLSSENQSVPLLFEKVIHQVFGDDQFCVDTKGIAKRFSVDRREAVEAADLPDGFRSTAAWIADLCAAWCRRNPGNSSPSTEEVEALVLIDEIDLHLHPSLQRQIVPRLRTAFPKVQWIVTTHSPLVLANFDRVELIALDSSARDGIRVLDREIKGFTTDEIYTWLMDTPPTGVAIEQELAQAAAHEPTEELAVLLRNSPQVNEEEARRQVTRSRELLSQLNAE